ncbi:hypothetical protein JCM6882_000502 [Rhodosporidiobolus microsporus]
MSRRASRALPLPSPPPPLASHPPRPRPRPAAALPSSRRHNSSAVPRPLSHPPPTHFQAPPTTKSYGQPLPSTHPHLLAPGELTLGISAREYADRRARLMEGLEDGAVVVITGGKTLYMTQNIFYRFRQRSNFWYLTGFEEPDSALVLQKDSSAKGYRMTLFVRQKDAYDELWNGARTGIEGACEVFGADDAVDSSYFTHRLRSLLSSSRGPVYIDLPDISPSRSRPSRSSRSFIDYLSGSTPKKSETDEMLDVLGKRELRSGAKAVERLRLIKSEAEVKVMRKAAEISCAAHSKMNSPIIIQVMRLAKPGISENALVSHFEHHTSLAGSPRPAYVPVCASGTQALTIHYIENNRRCKEGEMVLLDAGCEYGGYCSDITRTFPVSSTFSTAQKHLYEAVLRVLKHTTTYCTASANLSLEELHRISVDATRTELRDLGFQLRGGDLERVLYPHFVSHPLGVDLHDTMSFTRDEKLKAGMVITVEPGLYVPPLPHFPKGFHNQVVRLEDEVLVRDDDYVVLSVDAPKEVADVEARCLGLLDGVGVNKEE